VTLSINFSLSRQKYYCIIVDNKFIKNLKIYFRWQELEMKIVTYPEFQRDDFVVVAQPTLMNLRLPLASDGYTDMTYLSSDCFHFSQKSHAHCKFTKNSLKKISNNTVHRGF